MIIWIVEHAVDYEGVVMQEMFSTGEKARLFVLDYLRAVYPDWPDTGEEYNDIRRKYEPTGWITPTEFVHRDSTITLYPYTLDYAERRY